MRATPSSGSPETSVHNRPLSRTEQEALAWLDVSLSCGASLLRPMIKRMLAEGLDAQKLYLSAVGARQYVMERNGYPPLRVPTWDEVNLTNTPKTNPETFEILTPPKSATGLSESENN